MELILSIRPLDRFPKNHYGALLVDPPWRFLARAKKGERDRIPQRGIIQDYKTMSLADLKALPVKERLADNAAVFMWGFGTMYPQMLELGDAWGLRFITDVWQWGKTGKNGRPCFGMGYWSRRSVETVFMFANGRPKRLSKSVRQFKADPRLKEHSRKPESIYDDVEALVDGPYLEMFARQQRIGWGAWGDEIYKFGISGGKAGQHKLKP